MYAHRVQIFHVAYGDGRVVFIPNDLVFYLLVALYALFHQHLMDGGELQGVFHYLPEFRFVVGKAAAGAAQRKGRAQHHGVADLFRRGKARVHGLRRHRGQHRLADGFAHLLEKLPVLSPLYTARRGAQKLGLTLPQDALFFKLHGKVKPGLAADARHYGVGPLVADDLGHIFKGQRLHVYLVGNGLVGHYGGGVGVYQHHLIALFPQCKTGLCAGVVELRRLPDDDGAGADDHYFVYVRSFRHGISPPQGPR